MLSEVSQSQKKILYDLIYMEYVETCPRETYVETHVETSVIETEGKMILPEAIGRSEWELNRYTASVYEDGKVLETDGSDGCATV